MGLNKTSVAGKSRCATLAGGGGGPPGLAQPKRSFPEAAPPHAGTTRGPASAASQGGAPGPRGRRLDPPPRGGRGGNAEHEHAEHERAENADGVQFARPVRAAQGMPGPAGVRGEVRWPLDRTRGQ